MEQDKLPYRRFSIGAQNLLRNGDFDDPALAGVTKRLVFSSWAVVPQVIASLVSYEVERLMMRSRG